MSGMLYKLARLVWKPMKTNYIDVVFNRKLGIIGSEGFDLHNLFSHALVPIPTSLFFDDGSMISASLKKLNNSRTGGNPDSIVLFSPFSNI